MTDLHADPGIPESVRLTVSTDVGPVLDASLIELVLKSRFNDGVVLPFTYRMPFNPDDPNALRPLQRAVVLIVREEDARYPMHANTLTLGGPVWMTGAKPNYGGPVGEVQAMEATEDLGSDKG